MGLYDKIDGFTEFDCRVFFLNVIIIIFFIVSSARGPDVIVRTIVFIAIPLCGRIETFIYVRFILEILFEFLLIIRSA